MTQLLVSVRSREEARAALAGGADWIDVKEPARGSLGRADAGTIREIIREVSGQRPVSVALGELVDWQDELAPEWTGIAAAKLALAGCGSLPDWRDRWRAAWRSMPASVMRVAVAYADFAAASAPSPEEVFAFAAESGCGAFLLDTWNKSGGSTLSLLSLAKLKSLAEGSRRTRMLFVLAGSLTLDSIRGALAAAPDFVAVRGAVCRGGRTGNVDAELIRTWHAKVSGEQWAMPPSKSGTPTTEPMAL